MRGEAMPVIELTEHQRQQLKSAELLVIDPTTKQTYVLVRSEDYQQMKALVEGKLDVRESYPLMDAVAAKEGWDDPAMDIYNDFARES
jgi:hypothetical protein